MRNPPIESQFLKKNGIFTMLDLTLWPAERLYEMVTSISDEMPALEVSHFFEVLKRDGLGPDMELDDVIRIVSRELARDAVRVQDACNLSGVVHAFSDHLRCLRWISDKRREGNDWIHNHFITRAWADKIAALTHIQNDNEAVRSAHIVCARLAETEERKEATG